MSFFQFSSSLQQQAQPGQTDIQSGTGAGTEEEPIVVPEDITDFYDKMDKADEDDDEDSVMKTVSFELNQVI